MPQGGLLTLNIVSLIDCHPTQGGNPLRLIPILTTAFGGQQYE